jgi:hypothetical protein
MFQDNEGYDLFMIKYNNKPWETIYTSECKKIYDTYILSASKLTELLKTTKYNTLSDSFFVELIENGFIPNRDVIEYRNIDSITSLKVLMVLYHVDKSIVIKSLNSRSLSRFSKTNHIINMQTELMDWHEYLDPEGYNRSAIEIYKKFIAFRHPRQDVIMMLLNRITFPDEVINVNNYSYIYAYRNPYITKLIFEKYINFTNSQLIEEFKKYKKKTVPKINKILNNYLIKDLCNIVYEYY